MSGKKVISIRFHADNKKDMELYERLELEAGSAASLASVVKARIRDSYNKKEQSDQSNGLQDKIIAVVREEIREFGMKLVGAILSGMAVTGGGVLMSSTVDESKLPEKSEDLPNGALDFLE